MTPQPQKQLPAIGSETRTVMCEVCEDWPATTTRGAHADLILCADCAFTYDTEIETEEARS